VTITVVPKTVSELTVQEIETMWHADPSCLAALLEQARSSCCSVQAKVLWGVRNANDNWYVRNFASEILCGYDTYVDERKILAAHILEGDEYLDTTIANVRAVARSCCGDLYQVLEKLRAERYVIRREKAQL
jgi:hypothetical protein